MKSSSLPTARHILDGTARVFLAEALVVPTRLLTVTFLTRQLGPESFGLFTLAAAIVGWIESSISTLFSRPALKLVSESDDLKSVGATIVRLYLAVSLVASLVLCLVSALVARLFDEPRLAMYCNCLRWIFRCRSDSGSLQPACRNRGFQTQGVVEREPMDSSPAVSGHPGRAWVVDQWRHSGKPRSILTALVIARLYVRPRLWTVSIVKVRGLWDYVGPWRCFRWPSPSLSTMDLLMLKALGATAESDRHLWCGSVADHSSGALCSLVLTASPVDPWPSDAGGEVAHAKRHVVRRDASSSCCCRLPG